jgi:cysteine-rich repeat protein
VHRYKNILLLKIEPCGDGLNFGFNQCDDGNTANGDGCSSTCIVETGYNCFWGSNTTKDTCVSITSTTNPNMLYQDLGVGQMLVYFDQAVLLEKPLSQMLNFKIMNANNNNIVTSYNLTSLGSNSTAFNRYLITFYCSQDYSNGLTV